MKHSSSQLRNDTRTWWKLTFAVIGNQSDEKTGSNSIARLLQLCRALCHGWLRFVNLFVLIQSNVAMIGYLGIAGSTNSQLNVPRSIARDAFTGALYVADYNNHRVMKWQAGIGAVIAGGNGAGTNPNQLNNPSGVVLDMNATVLYISNAGSHNIKRWIIGSTTGTVVAGDSAGSSGSTSLLLNAPLGLAIDM